MKTSLIKSVLISAMFGVATAAAAATLTSTFSTFDSTKLLYTEDQAPRNTEAVILVDMEYYYDQWKPLGVKILPCGAPTKAFGQTSSYDPLIELSDYYGEIKIHKSIPNPRVILVEDPKEPAALLRTGKLTFRLPYTKGISVFKYYEKGREQKYPSATVRLDSAIKAFYANGGFDGKAGCQIPPVPVLDDSKIPPTRIEERPLSQDILDYAAQYDDDDAARLREQYGIK